MIDGDGILFDAEARRDEAVIKVGVRGGRKRGGDARLQTGAGLGEGFTDAHGKRHPVRDGAIAEARLQRLLEFAFEEALLDDRLQRAGEILNAHVSSLEKLR